MPFFLFSNCADCIFFPLFFSPSLQLHSGPVQCQTSHTGLSGQYLPQSIHIRCLLTLRPLCGHRGMRHKSCHQSLGARIAKWQSRAVQRRQCRCRVCRSQICRNMCGEYTERTECKYLLIFISLSLSSRHSRPRASTWYQWARSTT